MAQSTASSTASTEDFVAEENSCGNEVFNLIEGNEELHMFEPEGLPSLRFRWQRYGQRHLLKASVSMLLCLLLFVIVWQRHRLAYAFDCLMMFMIENSALGALCFVLVYACFALLTMPVFMLVLGAGYVAERVWGLGVGILIATLEVFVACLVSSSITFFLARHFCMRRVENWALRSKRLQMVQAVMEQQGTRVVLMLRLASIIPFGSLNWSLSILHVSFRSFILGSIGLFPYIISHVLIGSSLSSASQALYNSSHKNPLKLLSVIFGAVCAIIASVYISLAAKRILENIEKNHRRRSLRSTDTSSPQSDSCISTRSKASTEHSGDDDEHVVVEDEAVFALEHRDTSMAP